MGWTGAYSEFVVKTFFKIGESDFYTELFVLCFAFRWNDAVPDRKSILLWVGNSVRNNLQYKNDFIPVLTSRSQQNTVRGYV